jgi:hypothetical protein
MWLYTPVVPELKRLMQEVHEFKGRLHCPLLAKQARQKRSLRVSKRILLGVLMQGTYMKIGNFVYYKNKQLRILVS